MLQQRGEYLYGESRDDIEAYLRQVWPFELAEVEPVQVGEESALMVWIDVESGAAGVQRKSDAPGALILLEDSAERWVAPRAARMICACGSDLHEVSIGRQEEPNRWVIVGTRCVECGVLGSPLDWNISSCTECG